MRLNKIFMLLIASCFLFLGACGGGDQAAQSSGDGSTSTTSSNSSSENTNSNSEDTDSKSEATNSEAKIDWPKEPITIVVPYGPGGTSDRISRGLASTLSKEIGVPVNVVNIEGGGGIVGTMAYLHKPTNGQFIHFISHPHFGAGIIRSEGQYSYDQFAMLGLVYRSPIALWINAESEISNVKEFVEAAKASGGEFTYAGMTASYSDIAAQIFNKAVGIEARLVPYNGGGPVRASVISGDNDYSMTDVQGTLAAAKGSMKALMVFSKERSELLPDVPSAPEVFDKLGIDKTIPSLANAKSIIVNKRMKEKYPKRFEILMDAFAKTMQDEDLVAKFKKQGIYLRWVPGEEGMNSVLDSFGALKQFKDLIK